MGELLKEVLKEDQERGGERLLRGRKIRERLRSAPSKKNTVWVIHILLNFPVARFKKWEKKTGEVNFSNIFYLDSMSQFGLAKFQELSGHMWLVGYCIGRHRYNERSAKNHSQSLESCEETGTSSPTWWEWRKALKFPFSIHFLCCAKI